MLSKKIIGLILAMALVALPANAVKQQAIFRAQNVSAAGGTWTLVQQIWDRAAFAQNLTCTAAVCTITVAGLGAGHGILLFNYQTSDLVAPTITGGCAVAWVSAPSNAHANSGPAGSLSSSYCVSATGGATTITTTYSSAPADAVEVVVEAAWSGSSIAFDTCNLRNSGTQETNPPGAALTLTGTSDFITEMSGAGTQATAISSPYNTNFRNQENISGDNVSLGFVAGSFVLNAASGAAPTWTLVNDFNITVACALKGV